jgi:hypothetical protein
MQPLTLEHAFHMHIYNYHTHTHVRHVHNCLDCIAQSWGNCNSSCPWNIYHTFILWFKLLFGYIRVLSQCIMMFSVVIAELSHADMWLRWIVFRILVFFCLGARLGSTLEVLLYCQPWAIGMIQLLYCELYYAFLSWVRLDFTNILALERNGKISNMEKLEYTSPSWFMEKKDVQESVSPCSTLSFLVLNRGRENLHSYLYTDARHPKQ